MELKRINTAIVVGSFFLYAISSLLLTCGCTLRVGDAACREYLRAIEVRLTECELLPDDWDREQMRRVYAQCDEPGFLGLTITEADDVDDCIAEIRGATCERMSRGAPSCIGAVRL